MLERVLYIGKLSSGGKICEHLKNNTYEVRRSEGLRPSLRALNDFAAHIVVIDVNDASTINLRRITRTAGRRPGRPFIILLTDDRSLHFEDLIYDAILVRPFTYRGLDDKIRQLLSTLRLPIDDRGKKRAAARRVWLNTELKPVAMPDIFAD